MCASDGRGGGGTRGGRRERAVSGLFGVKEGEDEDE